MPERRARRSPARAFAVALLLAACVPPAVAADDARVERLMAVMGVDQMLGQMGQQMGTVMQQTAQNFAGTELGDEQRRILEKYMGRMSALMYDDANRARLKALIAQIYTSQFSDREIDDTIRFYESETGRSMVAKMPQVMQQSTQAAVGWVQQMKPALDQLTAEMKLELQQSLSNTPPPRPAKSSP